MSLIVPSNFMWLIIVVNKMNIILSAVITLTTTSSKSSSPYLDIFWYPSNIHLVVKMEILVQLCPLTICNMAASCVQLGNKEVALVTIPRRMKSSTEFMNLRNQFLNLHSAVTF